MSNILVTGADGFIGSALIPKLQEAGHSVIRFLGRVEAHRNWVDAPSGCEAIIHLAALNDLYGCEQVPIKSFYSNYWGAMMAFKYSVENNARFIFPSTDTVYGLSGVPVSVYDSHKLAVERSIMSIPKRDTVVLRLSTVYGPSPSVSRQWNRGIVNRWCKMALEGKTLTVYEGVKDCFRDYVHIDDVVGSFIKALEAPSGVYHVCTGYGTTVGQMASLINAMAGGKGGVEYVPDPEGLHAIEYRTWLGDYHLYNWYTSWRPETSVVDGIKKTVDYFASKGSGQTVGNKAQTMTT